MGWFSNAWNWIGDKIALFIKESSWIVFAKAVIALLIILAVIGIVAFWWWLLNKALNHGGDH